MSDTEQLDFSPSIEEYKPGDTMLCKIFEKQPGGYNLTLPEGDIREAFLPTSVQLESDDEIEVFYVCSDGKRIFLSLTEEEFRRRMQLRAERLDQSAQ